MMSPFKLCLNGDISSPEEFVTQSGEYNQY